MRRNMDSSSKKKIDVRERQQFAIKVPQKCKGLNLSLIRRRVGVRKVGFLTLSQRSEQDFFFLNHPKLHFIIFTIKVLCLFLKVSIKRVAPMHFNTVLLF